MTSTISNACISKDTGFQCRKNFYTRTSTNGIHHRRPICRRRKRPRSPMPTTKPSPESSRMARPTDGKLFISHSSKDDGFVRELREALALHGQDGWIDFGNEFHT